MTLALHRRAVALAAALAIGAPAAAASWSYLARDERLCAPGETACVRGTLSFERNYRVLRLRGRVESAPGPGLFTITVRGVTRQGYGRYAPMEIRLRGKRSEIVDFKMIPDHPDVYEWAIERIEFTPNEE
jgi:hypothetical protein